MLYVLQIILIIFFYIEEALTRSIWVSILALQRALVIYKVHEQFICNQQLHIWLCIL